MKYSKEKFIVDKFPRGTTEFEVYEKPFRSECMTMNSKCGRDRIQLNPYMRLHSCDGNNYNEDVVAELKCIIL